MNLDERVERAVDNFMQGYGCCQSVVAAFADLYGMDDIMAKRIAAGFGGGVGRTREVCGAVTGAALVLGMRHGPDKNAVYPSVQDFIAKFKAECGSVVCRELLAGTGATTGGTAEERTKEYYRKRPCVELVKLAAGFLEGTN